VDNYSGNIGLSGAILGKNPSDINYEHFEKPVHRALVDPLNELKSRARKCGFDLQLASGYRDFNYQLSIWNAKATGKRAILDAHEIPLDAARLNKRDLLFAILRWSALPGTSRHHWGTDFDVFDANAIDSGYQLQLTRSETEVGGVFEEFYIWLTCELNSRSSPFFRPYFTDVGGVAPEPWHLSHRALAEKYVRNRSIRQLEECIKSSDIALKEVILEHLEEVCERFVSCVNK